jgi:hypothetical protein
MRDDLDDDHGAEEGAFAGWRARLTRAVSVWGGAALAVAVITGVALWGWNLAGRDASEVPVIRAALSPAKVQPDDPGGAEIAYQDISAYRAGSGTAAPTEIVFAPPPERPSPEDVAVAALTGEGATASDASPALAASASPAATEGAAPAVAPLVRARPADLRQRMAAARQAASEEEKLAERAAASPVQIQLGAFPEREQTETMWERIYRANEDILRGRALVVQSTISGGRRFFRLRAGPFDDRIEAQNVCRALQSRGQDCLVAVNG